MSHTDVLTTATTEQPTEVSDLKLEAVVIPVADVDRSKAFYAGLGWRLDADFAFDNGFRVVQLTSPGSPTSVQFGNRITTAEPGTAQGLYLVVPDIQAARDDVAAHGVAVSEVFHAGEPGAQFVPGRNGSGRVPGRRDSESTSFASAHDLTQALIRAATAHGEHEARHGGTFDEQWPAWYAAYLVAEQSGAELPE